MESTTRQTFLGARIGSAACGAGIGYARRHYQTTARNSRTRGGRGKGEKGTACSLPSCDADAGRRSRREAAQGGNRGSAEVEDDAPPQQFPCAQGRGRKLRARRSASCSSWWWRGFELRERGGFDLFSEQRHDGALGLGAVDAGERQRQGAGLRSVLKKAGLRSRRAAKEGKLQ